MPALVPRALSSTLTLAQRIEAIDTIAFIDDPLAPDALSLIANMADGQRRERAIGWLVRNRAAAWKQWQHRILFR